MSDDESRHGHLPTEGDEILEENGSETVENDPTGYQLRERSYGPGGSSLEIVLFLAISNLAAAQVKNFYVFGCGWWYDREIVLLPPLCEYRERV